MQKKAVVLLIMAVGCIFHALPSMADENALAPWGSLIKLRSDATEVQAARSQRQREEINFKFQRIEQARGPNVNFDDFSVTITKLPTSGPTTTDELFQYIRLHIDEFMDKDFATLKGYNTKESADWKASGRAPLGTIMHFTIPWLNVSQNSAGYVAHESAAVVVTESSQRSWTFSTVTIGAMAPGEHPVSGNRQFGWRDVDGTFGQIYTRGVDRAIGGLSDPPEKTIFRGADGLWSGFQRNVKAFVEKNGGEARIDPPVIRRPSWLSPDVASLRGKGLVEHRVEAKLVEQLKLRDNARQQTVQSELTTWPLVLKKRAWTYMTEALRLACANPRVFENRYRNEKLPGVHFTKNDFDEFYAEFYAKGVGDNSKSLNECQKFILRDMKQAGKPVSISWVVNATERFRAKNPTLLERLAKSLESASQGVDSSLRNTGNSAYKPSNRSTEREPRESESRGISGYGNINLSPPKWDGGTLGH